MYAVGTYPKQRVITTSLKQLVVQQLIRPSFFVVALLLLSLLGGCSTKRAVKDKLLHAESICVTQPEKAMEIISHIDEQDIRGRKDMAHYRLVRSEVYYYNHIGSDRDTLTRDIIEYYSSSDNHDHRARAMYQHAYVLVQGGVKAEAMLSIMNAEESLAKAPNLRLEGLVSRLKGDIYIMDCLFEHAYDAYKHSKECFERSGNYEHRAFAIYDMADALDNMRRYDEAVPLYEEALEYAVIIDNKNLLCGVLHGLCQNYISTKQFDKCRQTLNLFEEYDCLMFYESFYYCLRAIVDSYAGDVDSALKNIEHAELKDDARAINTEYSRYVISRNLGDYESALYWLERNKRRQDSITLIALRQPVLNTQVKLLKRGVEQEIEEHRLINQRDAIVLVSLVFLIIVGVVYTRMRWIAREEDVANYMDAIKELGGSAELLRNEVYTLYGDRFKDLNRMCETYYEHGNTPREATKLFEDVKFIIDAVKSDDSRIVALERIVNLHHNNLVARLREECPRLNDRELKVVLYSYAGFSSRAICIFLDSDLAQLSRLKYKIKTKLHESGISDYENITSKLLGR